MARAIPLGVLAIPYGATSFPDCAMVALHHFPLPSKGEGREFLNEKNYATTGQDYSTLKQEKKGGERKLSLALFQCIKAV